MNFFSISNDRLNTVKFILITLYISFNFIDRHISNLFLLICLALCLYDFRNLSQTLKRNKNLVIYIIIFSLYIAILGYYHDAPSSELDNYFRLLLLLPLLSISISKNNLVMIVKISALFAFIHLFYNLIVENPHRYQGTSSNAITYGNLCALMFIICIHLFFDSKSKVRDKALFLSALTFLLAYIFTETRGPMIGILLSLFFLLVHLKNKSYMIFFAVLITSIIMVPNPLFERMKILKNLDFQSPTEINNRSLRERLIYYDYGVEKLNSNSFLYGQGPQDTEKKMLKYLKSHKIESVNARDHLHNEFLDISVKFGIPALILLLLIYFALYKSSYDENEVMINLILIMLVSSQLTQSHFAHHQAITFFIAIAYLIIDLKLKSKHDTINN